MSTQVQSARQTQHEEPLPAGYEKRWWALLFINISLLIIAIDNTILNVAIPSISIDLGATSAEIQWIIDAYGLIFAALLLTMGAVSDRYGRKRWLQIGVALFGLGSLAASFTESVETLIAARAFLGISAALILPSTLSLVISTFPKRERPQAIAIWAATFGIGVGIGPVVGGYLVEHFDWNAIFYVNVPVAIIAIIGGYFFITESRDENAPSIDYLGALLSIIGLFTLVFGIIRAGELGWGHSEVTAALGVAGIVLTSFIIWELLTPKPMLPMGFFRNLSFSSASLSIALVFFALFGTILFLTQYMQTILGFSPFGVGLRILPVAFSMGIASGISAQFTSRIGIKLTVAIGIFLTAAGLMFSSQFYDVDSSYGTIAVGMVLIGSGLGLAISPATDSIMGSVPESKAGIGSAMNDTTREIGGAMGVAVLGTILNNIYIDRVGELVTQLPALPEAALEAVTESIQAAHIVAASPQVPEQAATLIVNTANSAFVEGMTDAMFIGAVIMIASGVFALVALPNRLRAGAASHGAVEIAPSLQPAYATTNGAAAAVPTYQRAYLVPMPDNRATDATTVMTVLRDIYQGDVLVRIGGRVYRGLADAPQTRHRFAHIMRELADTLNASSQHGIEADPTQQYQQGSFPVQVAGGGRTDVSEVVTVLRDVYNGQLMVQYGGQLYHGFADVPATKAAFIALMRETAQLSKRSSAQQGFTTAPDAGAIIGQQPAPPQNPVTVINRRSTSEYPAVGD
ncbi:MAG: DHA2 family efflux MFS transporter permease subunit [Chloroflexi bacterium]|nr:MAG: DHA2 family efflux MFS transporter permease subunit [Chloroflexota bacterium]